MKKVLTAVAASLVISAVGGAPMAAPATGAETSSPWMFRLRALGVVTRDSGSVDTVAGSNLSTSDTVVPEFDITYFFSKNIAAELILATTRHSVTGDGTISGLPVGKAWLLPPTLTLQYHFIDFGAVKPYVGAGVNYTWFYSQSAGNATVGGLTVTSSHLHNSFGWALQGGFDYMFNRHWGMNFDIKKVFLRPNWDGTINGAPFTGKVNLDPWLIGLGVVYKL